MTREDIVQRLEAAGHVLVRDEDGVDFCAYMVDDPDIGGGHNGPSCSVCKDSWCEHCNNTEIDACEGIEK